MSRFIVCVEDEEKKPKLWMATRINLCASRREALVES